MTKSLIFRCLGFWHRVEFAYCESLIWFAVQPEPRFLPMERGIGSKVDANCLILFFSNVFPSPVQDQPFINRTWTEQSKRKNGRPSASVSVLRRWRSWHFPFTASRLQGGIAASMSTVKRS